MQSDNDGTLSALRTAKLAIDRVLDNHEAGPDDQESSTGDRDYTATEDVNGRVQHMLTTNATQIRLSLGTSDYSRNLSNLVDSIVDAPARFVALCSPDLNLDYVAQALDAECLSQCRVSHLQVPNWLIVDERCALIESSEPGAGMIQLTSPSIIEILSSWFDQVWRTSTKYDIHARLRKRRECELTREILAHLAQGATDEAAASRLGISVRTYRRHISELYDDLDAQSRFQAGMRAERLLVRYFSESAE